MSFIPHARAIKTYKKVWLLLTSLLTSHSLNAKEVIDKPVSSHRPTPIEKKIAKAVDNYALNNAFEGTVLVAKSGQIVFKQAYGFANRAKSQETTLSHAFQIASLSKPITATLILKLEEQGKLKLTHTLADYFPAFDNTKGERITLGSL